MSRNSRETPPVWVQNNYINRGLDVYSTNRGWAVKHPNGMEETLVYMKNLATVAGGANILTVNFGAASYAIGDALSVKVKYNEKVTLTAGATLVVTAVGGDKATGTLTATAGQRLLPIQFATGTLTASTNFAADDTVITGGQTYTFKADPAGANQVDVGTDLATSLTNLAAAITAHASSTVTATATGTTVVVTAKTGGVAGNDITSTVGTNTGNGTWAHDHLLGGLAAETITVGGNTYTMVASGATATNVVVGTTLATDLTALKNAINAKTNSTVTATSTATTLVVTAKTAGVAGNSITSTGTCANAAWGAGTLAGGAAATNITLYAAAGQTGTTEIVFSKKTGNSTNETVPDYDTLTLSVGAQTITATVVDAVEGNVASSKVISSALATACGSRVVA